MAARWEEIETKSRRTILWRGKRMVVTRYRYGYAIYFKPQKIYFSQVFDPLDWSSGNYTVETKTPA